MSDRWEWYRRAAWHPWLYADHYLMQEDEHPGFVAWEEDIVL